MDSDCAALEKTAALLQARYPGAHVLPIADGMEAVQYAYRHPVDAVYTEVLMPRITGFDVTRLIRKFHPDTKGYVVTRTADHLNRARREGLAGYYLKDAVRLGVNLMREAARTAARFPARWRTQRGEGACL